MVCFYPLGAYRLPGVSPQTGKRGVKVIPRESWIDDPSSVELFLPCGQCTGCRLERSRQWAMRCIHENQLHDKSAFITLTYDDAHLPVNGSLTLRDYQLFCKRLRKRHGPFRFFHAGEYGSKFQRPHYHALIFGVSFDDWIPWRRNKNGDVIYTSQELDKLWSIDGDQIGFCTIGHVTFQSAAYTARYCMKKVTGEKAVDHYKGRAPEYTTMSRRPGIGKEWLDLYADDVYGNDFVIVNGKKVKPPLAYDRYLETELPDLSAEIKEARMLQAEEHAWNNTESRLAVRQVCTEARISQLKRSIE